jgi:hypothetical protein
MRNRTRSISYFWAADNNSIISSSVGGSLTVVVGRMKLMRQARILSLSESWTTGSGVAELALGEAEVLGLGE